MVGMGFWFWLVWLFGGHSSVFLSSIIKIVSILVVSFPLIVLKSGACSRPRTKENY